MRPEKVSSSIIESILAHYHASFYDSSSSKVFVSDSGKSLIAYESIPIGIPYARDITILTTEEDEDEVFTYLQDLLQSKTKWVHVAVSVNKGIGEEWFQQNRFHILYEDDDMVRYTKVLDKARFKHLKEKYIGPAPQNPKKRPVSSDDVYNVEVMAL